MIAREQLQRIEPAATRQTMRKAKTRAASRTKPNKPAAKTRQPRPVLQDDSSREHPAPDSETLPRLMSPLQCRPVERGYLRTVIGKHGAPALPDQRLASKAAKKLDRPAGNFFVQLAAFHIRDRRF
jgi:hypothetical protein